LIIAGLHHLNMRAVLSAHYIQGALHINTTQTEKIQQSIFALVLCFYYQTFLFIDSPALYVGASYLSCHVLYIKFHSSLWYYLFVCYCLH